MNPAPGANASKRNSRVEAHCVTAATSVIDNMLSLALPKCQSHGGCRAFALCAADIPCSEMSSGCGSVVGPGGGFVVGGMGAEAAVQDADEAVAELAESSLVADPASAEGLVVGLGAG